MITVFLIAWNEEVLLPYTVKHYRQRFPGCGIVVYDNFSTDNTRQLARDMGCRVLDFYTGNRLDDQAYLNIKNNCWKTASTDWVIVCDVDEWLDIYPEHLQSTKASIIRTWFTNMVNMKEDYDVDGMEHGVIYRDFPGKWICFNRRRIQEINYDFGAHTAHPIGEVVFSEKEFLLLHYKYVNLEHLLQRHKQFGLRLSKGNLKKRLGFHYRYPAYKIRQHFYWHRKHASRLELIARPEAMLPPEKYYI